MFDLTPSERRGALVVLALIALAAGWDLAHRHDPPAPAMDRAPGVADAGLPPGPQGPPGGASVPGPAPGGRIELNSATASQLDELPGIGPVLARRIVEHRAAHGPFRSPEELLAVRGIGTRLLERIRPRITLSSPPRADATPDSQNAIPPRR